MRYRKVRKESPSLTFLHTFLIRIGPKVDYPF
jgi:hypothetical protein